jgi:hypothetical protein
MVFACGVLHRSVKFIAQIYEFLIRGIEAINNAIKVIKRRAYGYRDEEYFFLKIRAAFPGKPR